MSDTSSGNTDPDYAADDPIEQFLEANELETNDAVAGETVLPGAGEGNEGPTGGSPRELQPVYDEHGDVPGDVDPRDIDLDDQR